jgi:hypothetical protein
MAWKIGVKAGATETIEYLLDKGIIELEEE